MSKISFLTVNYNIDLLTRAAISSLNKYCSMPGVIIDNSDKKPLRLEGLDKHYKIIDNRNNKLTGNYRQPSKNHCSSIDFAIKNIVDTEYVLLFDSDILFGPNIVRLLNIFQEYDAVGQVCWDDAPPERLLPYMCIFNVDKLKRENISYFDDNRCIGPGSRCDDICGPNTKNWFYDTGASFYEDIRDTWNIRKIDIGRYCLHMKGAMLNNLNYKVWLYNNRMLWTKE